MRGSLRPRRYLYTQAFLDLVGDAKRIGDDGQRRVHRTDRGKETRIGHVEIVDTVNLTVEIQYRRRRILVLARSLAGIRAATRVTPTTR